MTQKKSNKFFIIATLIVVLIGVGLFSQGFTILGEEVWIPKYFSGECITRADNLATISIAGHTDEPTWYHCTSKDSGKHIPLVSGVECEYIVSDFSTATIRVCEGTDEKLSDSKCTDDLTSTFGDKQSFTVDAGDSIYINTDSFGDDATLNAKYPSYGIQFESADGFKSSTTTSCFINTIDAGEFHTVDVGNRLQIIPDVPFNAVNGLQRAISNQAVTLSDVENGKPIYISRPNYYHLIKTAEDGFKYVDTTREFSTNRIECIPRTTGCSDEAKVIPMEDQSCDKFGGAITNYAPVQGDASKLCKYNCESGKLSLSSDCIEVKTECGEETPLWDTTTGECVRFLDDNPEEKNNNLIILGIIVGVWAILMIVGIYFRRKGKI